MKSMMVRRIFQLCLFLCCATGVFLLPQTSYCELTKAINKYKDVSLSPQRLDKIAQYQKPIEYFAKFNFFQPRHKVSPDFMRALILAESNGNPQAISNKKAIGLAQIIASTGIEAGVELSKGTVDFHNVSRQRLGSLTEKDLFDPEVNILLAYYLIAKYNYRFNGQLPLVLTAWNAGENVKELKHGQYVTYPETLDLIGKVNGYYNYLLQQKKSRRGYRALPYKKG
jgi:soluble lytic murein transglycosylase-like protein